MVAPPAGQPIASFPYRAPVLFFAVAGVLFGLFALYALYEATTIATATRLPFTFGLRLNPTKASFFFGVVGAIAGLSASLMFLVLVVNHRRGGRQVAFYEEGVSIPRPLLRPGPPLWVSYSEVTSIETKDIYGSGNHVVTLKLRSGSKAEIVARMLPSPQAWEAVLKILRERT